MPPDAPSDDTSPEEPQPIPSPDVPQSDSPQPSETAPSDAPEGLTPGGYSYTVVDDEATDVPNAGGGQRTPMRVPRWSIVAAGAIVPAIIVGLLVWLFAGGGGGDNKSRASSDVANILEAFSQSQTGTTTRYEGSAPPGYPEDVPAYPDAQVVSSVLQLESGNAGYLVVSDSSDSRDNVVSYYKDALAADPWQVAAGQDTRETTLLRFTKIDDPDIEGLVLISDSKEGGLTTVVTSVQVTSGADASNTEAFELPSPRDLPDGFPDEVPAYDGAVLFQTAFQKQSGADQFVATYLTKDSGSDVLDFFRTKLPDSNLTVEDGDASNSSLENAEAITFSDGEESLTGGVTVGKFPEDSAYTRIDVQVSVTK